MSNMIPAVLGGTPLFNEGDIQNWPIFNNIEKENLLHVLESGEWAYQGPFEKEFTSTFSKYLNVNHGIAVSNGTVSLEIALRACGISEGDEVIVPAATWIATATAVLAVGGTPIFVDIDPSTLCISPEAIESAITENTRAIIPVHLYSRMADMDRIMEIAKDNNFFVIEDAAHSHGSIWKNTKAGGIGHLGSFSFQMKKLITSGEGGFITTNDSRLGDLCYSFMNCGRKRNESTPGVIGSNHRITEFQASILLSQFDRFKEQTITRDKNARLLDEELSKIEGIKLLRKQDQVTLQAYYMYVFQYDKEKFNGLSLDTFEESLRAEGIVLRSNYTPVYRDTLYPYESNIKSREDYLPETEKALQNTLLLHHTMLLDEKHIEKISAAINKVKAYSQEIEQKMTSQVV